MLWNFSEASAKKYIKNAIIDIIIEYNDNYVPLNYIYKHINKYLKSKNIILKLNNKRRSVNYYIKFTYKTWNNFLIKLDDKLLINNNYIIFI